MAKAANIKFELGIEIVSDFTGRPIAQGVQQDSRLVFQPCVEHDFIEQEIVWTQEAYQILDNTLKSPFAIPDRPVFEIIQ